VKQLQLNRGYLVNNDEKEKNTLATRLIAALQAKGIKPSPTVVSQGFNEFSGNAVTPHTARNWMLGRAFPQHDKLVALGKWLEVSPSELRYGHEVGKQMMFKSTSGEFEITQADRKMIESYLRLPIGKQELIRDVVETYSRNN
jgi:hypothetical protein